MSVYSVPLGIIKKGLLLKDNTLRKYIKRKSAAGHESECKISHLSCSNPERLSHFDDGEDDDDYDGGNDDELMVMIMLIMRVMIMFDDDDDGKLPLVMAKW